MKFIPLIIGLIAYILFALYLSQFSNKIPKKTSPSPTPVASSEPQKKQESKKPLLDNFYYPDAEIITNKDNILVLQSDVSPEKVTSWYDSKIKSLDYNVTNIIKSTVNGKINHKFSASNKGEVVKVSISNQNQTRIVVEKTAPGY